MAVLPAGVPERATDFFGLNTGGEDTSSILLIDHTPRAPNVIDAESSCLVRRPVVHKQFIQLSLIGKIVEITVKIGPRLHERNYIALRALRANGFIYFERGRIHGPISRAAVENNAPSRRGQLVSSEQGSLPKFGDVC